MVFIFTEVFSKNAMKMFKGLPVCKNKAKNKCNNYTPISLLPLFIKILKKLFDLRT